MSKIALYVLNSILLVQPLSLTKAIQTSVSSNFPIDQMNFPLHIFLIKLFQYLIYTIFDFPI